ncbi:MAG TPA: class I SAM-dependent methyltransferase [Chthoniobacterales bacterium]
MPDTIEKSYRPEVCNVCGSQRYRRVHYFAEWNLGRDPVRDVSIVRCRGCGVRRRLPGISDEYEEIYHEPYVAQGRAIHPHQLSHFADLMTARLRKFNASGVRFLDVGCSTGRALRLAATLGFEATGLDYSQWAVDYCRQLGFETRHGSLIGQWEDAEMFDVIHCSHTIEHVPDPAVYISEMHRLLRPNGQLMLAFPNYASFPRWTLRANWGAWCLDSHLWQFTAAQMRRLLRQMDFRITSCRTLHGYTPDSALKKKVLDLAALFRVGDGCNIIATKR